MTTGEAARVLGVSPETVRRWIRTGELRGWTEEREVRVRYFTDPRSVADLRQARSQVSEYVTAGESPSTGYSAGPIPNQDPSVVAAERDRYRAENAALREVILRLNAAMDHMRVASEQHALAFAEQQEALVQLITPHSPAG